jgi:hypothetical protein
MSIDSETEQKVWKFSYSSWNKLKLESIFAASQAEIDWIIGRTIDFGETLGNEQNIAILMEEAFFMVVSDDAEFTKNFVENIGSSGTSPFKNLNAEQVAEFGARFGGSYVNGQLVEASETTSLPAFLDEGSRIVTFDIKEELTRSIIEDDFSRNSEESQKQFLSKFEIISPQTNYVHLSQPVEQYGDGNIHCMSVIKRKSDGKLFGYPYTIADGDGAWIERNGETHGFERANYAYIWLPVTPFTITGYSLIPSN